MNNEPVAWKAYDEVNFSDQYILRWVREGDEYVNRISKEMMEDFKAIVEKPQLTDEQIKELYDKAGDDLFQKWKNNEGGIFKVEFARAIERAHGIGE